MFRWFRRYIRRLSVWIFSVEFHPPTEEELRDQPEHPSSKTRDGRQSRIIETPQRAAMRQFIDSVSNLIHSNMLAEPLRLHTWHAVEQIELYGNVGGNHGNVYLILFEQDTDLLGPGPVRVRVRLSFRVANKARKTRRHEFARLPLAHWATLLGIREDRLTRDDRGFVNFEETCQGDCTEVAQHLSAVFCRFLTIFRPFMSELVM